MKPWRLWVSTGIVIVVLGVITLCIAVWNNVSSEWEVEKVAAQYALNQTPLTHLVGHDVFTGDGVEDVFSGTDAFGHGWYAFVYGSPMQVSTVAADDVLSSQQIKQKVFATFHVQARSLHLGYVQSISNNQLSTPNHVVWEVSGKLGKQTEYLFVNAQNGALVWRYLL
jgi:uncharacterized protein YpmB